MDSLGEHRSPAGPVALLAVALVAGGRSWPRSAATCSAGPRRAWCSRARQRLVSRLLRLPVAAVDRLSPGDLLSRVVSDTTLLRGVTSYGLVQTANAVFALTGALVLMGLLDPLLLLVTVAVLALNGIAVVVVVPRIRRATERSQDAVRWHGDGAGTVAGRVPDGEGQRRRAAPDRRRARGRPAGLAPRRRGGRVDRGHGGLGRAGRAGVLPGRPRCRRGPGRRRRAAGVRR